MNVRPVFRRFGKIAGTLVLASVTLFIITFVITKVFTIDTIEVAGSGIKIIVDQKKLNKNLLFFPTEQLRQELLSENPILADIGIQKKFPNTLVLIPKLRSPIARIHSEGRTVDVDPIGYIVSDSFPTSNLPMLNFAVGTLRIGQKLRDPHILTALSIVSSFSSIVSVDSVTMLDSESLQVNSGTLRIYITQDPPPDIASTLQTLTSGFRIKGTLPKIIDLRYSKPVVTN